MMRIPLPGGHVPALLSAFDLGSWGRLSDGPVASGRLGSIWRLDTDGGSWAVKQVGEASDYELAALLEGAAFQEAALAAGVPTPGVRRTRAGELIVDFGGTIGIDAWYTEPVGGARWSELVAALRARRATFADELAPLVPQIVAR